MQEENTIDKATIEAAALDLFNHFWEDSAHISWEDTHDLEKNRWRKLGEYFVCVCTNANALSTKAFNEMFNN